MRSGPEASVASSDGFRPPHPLVERLRSQFTDRQRFLLNRFALDTPGVARAYLVARGNLRVQRPVRGADVVLDGFPRSANSYALYAFRVANPTAVIRGHTHSAQAVLRSARLGLPTVLVVREPDDAVASFMQMSSIGAAEAFHAYARFHRTLAPVSARIVVATFDEVTSDFGSVIDRVNARYGTAFHRYVGDEASERAVREALDEANVRARGDLNESSVSRPSAHRAGAGMVLGSLAPAAIRERDAAVHAYRSLVGSRGTDD